jgi:hypothetical protein
MKKEKNYRTDFLFATPTFLTGAGSIYNIAGNYYDFNTSPSGEIADTRALECDWQMVGMDLKNAICEFEKENASALHSLLNE